MGYQLPPLNWLRAFEAAARHSNFTAAADELSLTQAAVSHQVRSLERHLGFPLFERLARGVQLTDMARAYLPSVRKAFDELSMSTVGLFGPIGDDPITVRVPISFATLCLAPRLDRFRQAHPGIHLRLCTSVWADALEAEAVDIDIRFGDGRWDGHEVTEILNEPSVPVCSPIYAQQVGIGDRIERLDTCDVIQIMGCEDLWTRLLRHAGLSDSLPRQTFKADTSLVALELAAAGLGCTLVLRSFAQSYLERERLMGLFDLSLPIDQSHFAILREEPRRARPEVLLFREWLLDEFHRVEHADGTRSMAGLGR
jgi:LysR family transcriptional regulator, glycine cleavage system transcriptional activator